jgi:hypothetical protein
MFDGVLTGLTDANVSFVVTGGAAMALHRIPRPVADLDIVVDPAERNLDQSAVTMMRLGSSPACHSRFPRSS